MNINLVKKEVMKNINGRVEIEINGMRNKTEKIRGIIKETYPNIFTILINGEKRSFRYGDIITGEIKVKYL